jgi:tape measure domain-containing protein|nr:MAG TPA: Tail tape measure [Caudoviricetes sp.]
MAGKLSFSIAINLLTENFKRGSNQVKAAFKSIQMQFLTFAAALGAGGLGLSNFVSRLIEVARETNRVTTALKNVSGSMLQYADNQRYLLDLAKKYGLEINALTANYAKFTAAASISGMSMMDQRKIFESVSRACTAFGMSADDSNGVMLALSQMMSKGKISSEELRLQMGERLPVALQAMAKAAGVSVGGLDKLMKQGKLMSADVLPKFAEALNEMIPNVDTDNLETSVNRLKNAFTEFVNGTDVQSKYKALIDWLTSVVKSAADNIKSIVTYLVAAILVLVTNRLVNKIISSIAKAELAAKSSARRAAKDAGVAFDEVAWKAQKTSASIKIAFSKALGSLKALFISSIPTFVIAAIGAIIAKLYTVYQESKRIKNIYSDYQKNLWNASTTPEITHMQTLINIMNDRKKSQNEINTAQGELQKMLGKENLSQEELNKLVKTRIALLREAAMAEHAFNTVGEYSEKNAHLSGSVGLSTEQMDRLVKLKPIDGTSNQNSFAYNNAIRDELKKNGNLYKGISLSDVDKAVKEYIENNRVIADATNRAGKYQANASKLTTPIVDPDDDKKKTPLQKAEEEYQNSLLNYKNQLDAGAITQDKYNGEIDKLNSNTVVKLGGILGKSASANETYAAALQGTLNPRVTESAKAQAELSNVEAEYTKATDLAKRKLDKKLISEDDYRKALVDAAIAAANSAISIENIGDAADSFIKKMQGVVGDNLKIEAPKLGRRDTTFDYKKTDVDKKSEELDIWIEYRDDLKEKLEEAKKAGSAAAKSLEIEFNNAIANVDNMEEALKLAQVQEDIKNLNKELNESLYSGVKDIASSSDRIVSAFSNLRDVMNDVDASGWERIMAVWNAMTNVVDTFLSIIKMIESLTELTNKLIQAKEAEEAIDTAVTGTKVANAATETTAEITAIATQTAASVSANVAKTTAATTTMAAESTAAYAGIPFVGVGLAAAQIAAMEAMILAASIPKFATGGVITGGPTSGDKILARVNAGEMILNQGQQSRLFEAINSGKLGGSGNMSSTVTTRVRAKDLILTINNELKSQGKKPIS